MKEEVLVSLYHFLQIVIIDGLLTGAFFFFKRLRSTSGEVVDK
jgi:hypothetical protein